MALRKDFAEGTNYYYATISYLGLTKDTTGIQGHESTLVVDLIIKDSENPEFRQLENPFTFKIPHIKYKQVPNMVEVPELTETGEEQFEQQPVLDENNNPTYEQVPILNELNMPAYEQIPILADGEPVLDENNDPTFENGPQLFENGEQIFSTGKRITEEVQNGFNQEVDETYIYPFSVEAMKEKDPYKICYEWLRENIELFNDFEDVLED